jgi:putative transposase
MMKEEILMKKSKYSDAQIMSILKQAESGMPVADLCREHGMSSASFYKWRSKRALSAIGPRTMASAAWTPA